MILGALVADAAAMGLHWIYDQQRIQDVAPEAPEFFTPDKQNYDGVPAYFAHPTRTAGDLSQYGEQAMVMLRTLVAGGGHYDRAAFADRFRAHFGYGGAYVGYIDHATRDSLDNMRRFEDAAHACAKNLDFDGDPQIPKALVERALPMLQRYSGNMLLQMFEAEISTNDSDSNVVAFGLTLINSLRALPAMTGANDLQLPAIAKLPALVAMHAARGSKGENAFDQDVASAVRVTNDNPVAAHYSHIAAHMMLTAVTSGDAAASVNAGRSVAGAQAADLFQTAAEMAGQSNPTVTKHFGMSCDLPFGLPAAAHNIATATSFCDAVRSNIYSGGDTCGRAILVGAVMGAVHGMGGTKGIPDAWIDRLGVKDEAKQLSSMLLH
ncbi:ADP-ribosylglycohydrolase family protein [Sulfitobacter guttiformis]|uniref:ADP-ribosylglycohydrolase n=1 Tax=Sulfitobacter guttiformis TaxID=74349 RepID=A0A420DTW6_9RHOB|nr:ADP-ribosylglycohydrolase family protein [Sulfitobacter guttiformis]KIN71222.1 ADP-ribosylation/crystallin J1-like protein [Sulfitobacter guttiformis KCTC 32187]RKE97692.1 ADP-ribosylglycohydrolase [Sulfitobacter guttiformis]